MKIQHIKFVDTANRNTNKVFRNKLKKCVRHKD